MGTKKGQTRKTARKAYKPKKRMSLTEKAQRFGTTNRTKK